MEFVLEKRKYQRCTNVVCKTMLSTDKRLWKEIELDDISAGGIKFSSENDLDEQSKLFFNISVYSMLSKFDMRFEGTPVRKDDSNNKVYSVKFTNVDSANQIQLDELLESRITVAKLNQPQPNCNDGVYSFSLHPRLRNRC